MGESSDSSSIDSTIRAHRSLPRNTIRPPVSVHTLRCAHIPPRIPCIPDPPGASHEQDYPCVTSAVRSILFAPHPRKKRQVSAAGK